MQHSAAQVPAPPQIPLLNLSGRSLLSSPAAPSGSLSARLDRPKENAAPVPLTARPLGVTPRSAAMLGPRPGIMRGMDELLGSSIPASPKLTSPKLMSPRAARSPSRGSDVLHPARLARERGGGSSSGGDWMGAALDAAKGAANPSAATSWLAHACGCAVDVAGTQAELVGPSSEVPGEWDVRGATGALMTVAAAEIRRVPVARGFTARVVLGDSRGFVGSVLSAANGVAVLRSAEESSRVRVLPVDALCVVAQPIELA